MDITSIRFKNLLDLAKRYKKQIDFADAVKTDKAYISQLLSAAKGNGVKPRKIGDDFARRVEVELKLPYGWMDHCHNSAKFEPQNVTASTKPIALVPVLKWDGLSKKLESDYMIEVKEWTPTTGQHGPMAYALQVDGDSMSPDFMPGSLVIVDPDLEPITDSFVIVNNDESFTFKQLVKDGGDLFLKPVNPQYPIKPLGRGVIIGVVCEAVSIRRLV